MRRAGLPYAVSQGFNPHMRIAFGPALPVGTAGLREYYDLQLTTYVPAHEALAALARASHEELAAQAAAYVHDREPSLASALTVAVYEVEVEGGGGLEESLAGSLRSVVASGSLAVEHKGKEKVFELTEALPKEPSARSVGGGCLVEVHVRMSPRGSLRPDALVNAALAYGAIDGRVVSVMRTDLLIEKDDGTVRRPL